MKDTLFTCLIFVMAFCCPMMGQPFEGFFNYSYNEAKGTITLQVPIDRLNQEFLYVSSLSAGIGSNDIGLDRGQLGDDRVVKWIKRGNKLLLLQPNLQFRAISDNKMERGAVEEAFAQSVLWGFDASNISGDTIYVDLTEFLLRDAHGVTNRLQRANQGNYKIDKSRSAIWMDRTKAFPKNVEFDALLTFTGEPKGGFIRSVTPSPDAITVRLHHSFIELPDEMYVPREYHPYSGFNQLSYMDYATPIEQPIYKRYIFRHRLKKKNPAAKISEAVEPIIYYMDPGCPEPVKSALMEGASWWDQAFQAAGYAPGTFQVKELPPGADMLDVRYNVIQWVHRSTRGWSYGASVADPRTGEILKGHVSLGSLRVRQDFMIAQGLLSPYGTSDQNHRQMSEMALARLRQLAAHEVGHTIGLSHNFASSVNNRASVMDYPHPLVDLGDDGTISFDRAYGTGIGEWDKRAVLYGYQDFGTGTNEGQALSTIIQETQKKGLLFISDSDSRPAGGAHPHGHLWDNGENAVDEFSKLLDVRKLALSQFGENTITSGTPLSELEKILVPVYLLHRYQMEAVAKLIGGLEYGYYVKGDALERKVKPVGAELQKMAIEALLSSLKPSQLVLPDQLIQVIPPPAQGYRRDRETFSGNTGLVFDVLSPAESYVKTVMDFMLHEERLARIYRQGLQPGSTYTIADYLTHLSSRIFSFSSTNAYEEGLSELVQKIYFQHLLRVASKDDTDIQSAASIRSQVEEINAKYLLEQGRLEASQAIYLKSLYEVFKTNPAQLKLPKSVDMPPGSPIGCGGEFIFSDFER